MIGRRGFFGLLLGAVGVPFFLKRATRRKVGLYNITEIKIDGPSPAAIAKEVRRELITEALKMGHMPSEWTL